jgi:hypothetical protein
MLPFYLVDFVLPKSKECYWETKIIVFCRLSKLVGYPHKLKNCKFFGYFIFFRENDAKTLMSQYDVFYEEQMQNLL